LPKIKRTKDIARREDGTGVSPGLQNQYQAAKTVCGRFDSCPLGHIILEAL